MAMETLKGVLEIGGYKVKEIEDDPEAHHSACCEVTSSDYIVVDHVANAVAFIIQNGPIKENGVNGCQVDTLIHTALIMIKGLNEKFPCPENKEVIYSLYNALGFLEQRREDREKRGVEGTSNA